MPQMFPLNWIFLWIFFIFIFLIFNIMSYYNFKVSFSKPKKFFPSNKLIQINWKW
uniref:ATP synthase F0 subunit 8 n=1 Tax=Taxonus zhangi TaxID=2848090 RepID=A0A8F9SGX8_9HYME|nr:ATP synthase F0 subunit 8 [Taxonus zhangi]